MDGRKIKLLILAMTSLPFLAITFAGADILLTTMVSPPSPDNPFDMLLSSLQILAMSIALMISFAMSAVCLVPLRYWFTPPPEEPFDPADTYIKTHSFL